MSTKHYTWLTQAFGTSFLSKTEGEDCRESLCGFLEAVFVDQRNFWDMKQKVMWNCEELMTLFSIFEDINVKCLKMKNNANNVNFEDINVK